MYICDCAPGTFVISRLNNRAEKLVATRVPMACNVGGANPESVTMVRASTRLAAVECDSVAWAIWDNLTTALPSPVGRSTRNGDTSRIAWPGPPASSSASGYTDMGTIARIVDVVVTGSPRDSSQLRNAPATTARTTSLTSQS